MYIYVVVELDCPPYVGMIATDVFETAEVEVAFSKKDELEEANLSDYIEYRVEIIKRNPPSGE